MKESAYIISALKYLTNCLKPTLTFEIEAPKRRVLLSSSPRIYYTEIFENEER